MSTVIDARSGILVHEAPGGGEAERFAELQRRLASLPPVDDAGLAAADTVVAISSVDLGRRFNAQHDLASLETRWLYLILLLRRPGARLALVTSDRVGGAEMRYFCGLAGLESHEDPRLMMIALEDLEARPLTEKLLARPELLGRVRGFTATRRAFIAPFAGGGAERDLALALDVPVQAIDDRFAHYGTKSGARRLFEELRLPLAHGEGGLRDLPGLAAAIARLRRCRRATSSAVIKLEAGTIGSGNAVVSLIGLPAPGAPSERAAIERRLAAELDSSYRADLEGGAAVEELLDGAAIRSPSVQLRIRSNGRVSVIATHEQILGGPLGQSYAGCRFPADPAYAADIAEQAQRVGERLADEGAVGRLAIDFVVISGQPGQWRTYAIEINLREGGTTHPHGALALLTDGCYDRHAATFRTAAGRIRCYRATDSMRSEHWRGVAIDELLAAAQLEGIAYDHRREHGVVFLMLRSLPVEGRLGLVAIGSDQRQCDEFFEATARLLDGLSARRRLMKGSS